MRIRPKVVAVCAWLMLTLVTIPQAAADSIYLALGDSIAFGQTDVIPTSHGDQGYVQRFANHLASINGGVRPRVVNLAIPGETSDSFFTATTPVGGTRTVSANLNYSDPNTSQNSKMLAAIQDAKTSGHNVSAVSFALGSNDLLNLATSPAFQTATPAAQQQMIGQLFQKVQENYVKTLSQIREHLPNADLYLLDYYNPYAVLGPDDPANQLALATSEIYRKLVQADAAAFGGQFIDTYTPFLGHEVEYTYILSGSIHPNDLGYAAIARQLSAASVPEPGTLTLLSLGAVGMAAGLRRRRA